MVLGFTKHNILKRSTNMKTLAYVLPYVVASFVAVAPMHAYADDSQNICGNGTLNILNCNDVDVGVDVGQAQVPSTSTQVADDSNNACGNGGLNIGNCNDVDVDVDIG